jgi:hypothetical protein
MTFAASERIGISRQRGFWLRCFLGSRFALFMLILGVLTSGVLHAQATYDCFYVKTTKVAHLRGEVVDQAGHPVEGAKVELLKKGANDALASEQSGEGGQFQFDEPGGQYLLHVAARGFQPAGLNVRVDHGFFSFFNTRRLYVVLTAGGAAQACPAEITSKRKLREYVRDNATQK